MPKISVNTHLFDPYKCHKFRIKWNGKYVAGLSKCSALKTSTSRKIRGKIKYDAITLSVGITHDTTFEEWANIGNDFKGDAAMSLKNFRKDIIIDVYNEANQRVLSYKVSRCWVSEYQALPELDASVNAVMIQTIKLENEGWERDTSVTDPAET